jgi:hypothetical protein
MKAYKDSELLQQVCKRRRAGALLRNSFGGELGTWKMKIMLRVFGDGRHLYGWFKGSLVIEIQMLY